MIRAIAIAARLDFAIEPSLLKAIRTHHREIAKSALPRLIEEYYKILRAGSSEKAFRDMADVGLLEPIAAELHHGADDRLWRSLSALDAYRKQFDATPDTMSNAVLMGSLLVPLGISLNPPRGQAAGGPGPDQGPNRRPRHPPGPKLGDLPLARRDVERLRLILSLQRRLHDLSAGERAQRALAHRGIFREALTWMEIHGNAPEVVEHWMGILDDIGETGETAPPETESDGDQMPHPHAGDAPHKKRRRRRRRGRRGGGSSAPPH